MIQTSEGIGKRVQTQRKKIGITQRDLALTAGTGIRFRVGIQRQTQGDRLGFSLKLEVG